MPLVPPTRDCLGVDLRRRVLECRRQGAAAASLGDGIATVACQTAHLDGRLARCRERHQSSTAEPDIAAAPLYDDPQQPAPGARGIDDEIESIAVRVAAGLGQLPDSECGEGFSAVSVVLGHGYTPSPEFELASPNGAPHFTPHKMWDSVGYRELELISLARNCGKCMSNINWL